jgi:hypothetical protein
MPPLSNPAQETLPIGANPEVDTTAPELATTVSENVNRIRRNAGRGILALSVLGGITAILGPLLIDRSQWLSLFGSSRFVGAILAVCLILVLGLVVSAYWRGIRMRSAVRTLASKKDLSTVGSLVDVLLLDDGPNRNVASEALIEMLPRLQASDAHLLNAQHRDKLCRILSTNVDNALYKDVTAILGPASLSKAANKRAVDLRVAILRAFQQVGDSRGLPVVEKLATGRAKTPGHETVRNAAQDCLPYLRERVNVEMTGQGLLRVPLQPGHTGLVRPAADPTGSSAQLLRADACRPDDL